MILKATRTAGSQWLRDITGHGHDARLGSVGNARVMEPLAGNDGYLRLPGANGNYATVPDEPALDVTDLDVRLDASASTLTPSETRVAVSRDVTDRLWQVRLNTNGTMSLLWWDATSALRQQDSSAALTTVASNGQRLHLRYVLDVDNGAGVYAVRFYYRIDTALDLLDNSGWVLLGVERLGAATTSIKAGADVLGIGSRALSSSSAWNGRVYRAIVLDSIGGDAVVDASFMNQADGATTVTAETGQTVTINSTSGVDTNDPELITFEGEKHLWHPGTNGNYVRVPDVNLLDTRQASFDNVALDPTVTPEDRYEVWGSGGGTGVGTPGAASPFLIDLESYDVAAGLVLDGTTNTYASTPTSPRVKLTGDLEIVVDCRPEMWAAGVTQTLVAKYPSRYIFRVIASGGLDLWVRRAGGVDTVAATNAVVPFSDGQRALLRVRRTAATGATEFAYSLDGGTTWTVMPSTSTSAGNLEDPSDLPLVVGSYSDNRARFIGTIYEAQVRAGIDGLLVANPRFKGAHIAGGVGSFRDGQGNVWTLNGNAAIASGAPSQVGWLPGAVSNYFSVPDTNELDADTAHLHQSAGEWVAFAGASSAVHDTGDALYGAGSLLVTSNGGNVALAKMDDAAGKGVAVTAGTTVSASCRVKPSVAGRHFQLRLVFRRDDGISVGVEQGPWVQASGTERVTIEKAAVTVPANATRATIHVYGSTDAGATPLPNTETCRVDVACFRAGSDATFLPSHRIVSDLDLRARVALKDWTPGVNNAVLGKWAGAGARSYLLSVTTAGALDLRISSGGAITAVVSSAAVPAAGRGELLVRATWRASDGRVQFFTSSDGVTWTQLGTDQTITVASIDATTAEIAFSSADSATAWHLTGTYLAAEVRDGIDGPVVASIDLTEQLTPSTVTATTAEGHTVTLNRTEDATAEIVDRDTWQFTTAADYLDFGNRAEFQFAAGKDFEIAASAAARVTTYRSIMGNRGGANQVGFDMSFTNLGAVRTVLVDTQGSVSASPAGAVDDGTYHTISGRRVGTGLYARVDGVEAVSALDASNTDMSAPTNPFRIGSHGHLQELFAGGISWAAVFRRPLTDAERTALEAWDGRVVTEPSWLRPLAVFYVNANDPQVKASYATNEVLNLATAPYGDLGWMPVGATTSLVRGNTVVPPVGSTYLGIVGPGTNTFRGARTPEGPDAPDIDGTQPISASAAVWSSSPRAITLTLIFLDNAGGEIGRTAGAAVDPPGSTWTRISATEPDPPPGTAKIAVEITYADAQDVLVDAVVVRNGADVGYVPSLRIRENVDVRVTAASVDWTGAAGQNLIWKRTYAFDLLTGPLFGAGLHRDDGTPAGITAALAGLTDEQLHELRMTLDVDNGAGSAVATFLVDGVQQGQGTVAAVSPGLDVSTDALQIGAAEAGVAPLHGELHAMQLRDGIDGPVLLDIDFTAWPDDASTVALGNGLTAEIVRPASGRKIAVVEATKFLLGSDDYFEVADHPDLRPGASSMTLVALVRHQGDVATEIIYFHRTGSGVTDHQFGAFFGAAAGLNARYNDGTGIITATKDIVVGLRQAYVTRLDRVAHTIEALVDGVAGPSAAVPAGGAASPTGPVRIGADSKPPASLFLNAELYAVGLIRETLTAEQLADFTDYLATV